MTRPKTAIRQRAVIAVLLLAIVTSILAALAFVPALRDTRASRTIRFWDKPPPPVAAVAPGQLGAEMDQRDRAASAAGAIEIDPKTSASLGIQTVPVTLRRPDGDVRTTGRVVADERRITTVTSKVEGWVEQTYANFEGQEVRAGQPLFTIYSPDLVATENEYLLAIRSSANFETSDFEVVRKSGPALVESSRRRLELWGVTDAQIAEIERSGKAFRALTVYAPHSGVVTERKALPGSRVLADTPLYTLSDLSSVWIVADVFESDLPSVRVGTPCTVALAGGDTRSARVTYVDPSVDPQSRTTKARIDATNPGRKLLPGMYVDVTLRTSPPAVLMVPKDAVIDTGLHTLVFVGVGGGRFTLREVEAEARAGDAYAIRSGLASGDHVARNVQFLLDSETDLRQRVDLAFPGPSNGGAALQP